MSDDRLSIGTRVSERYEIREVLGSGTLGPAYKVYDHAKGRSGVLKVLPERFRKKSVLAKRFIKHYRALQNRDHVGMARIWEVAVHEGAPFVVCEFLEGLSLRQLIDARRNEGGPFGFDEVESIVEEVGQILSYLHQTGFHGAIKPENIFLLPDRIKLSDDGLMEILPPEVFARVQIKHEAAAPYLAPEILSDPEHVSKEVDIFGCAALVYALLAGKPPSIPPAPLEALRDDVPNGLDEVLTRALADQPQYRFPSINTFLLELARTGGDARKIRVLEEVVEAEAQEAAKRAARQAIAATEARPEPPSAADDDEPTELPRAAAPTPPPPSDGDAASLFDDETVSTAAVAPPSGGGELGDDTDLLMPTPSIEGGAKAKRNLGIAIAVVLVLAIGGAAAFFLQPGDEAAAPAPVAAPKPPDPQLVHAVEKVLRATESVEQEILAHGSEFADNPSFQVARGTLDAARTALAQDDVAAALTQAQKAQDQFAGLLDLLNVQADKAAQAAADAAAQAAEVAQTPAPKAKPAPTPTPAPPKPAPKPEVKAAAPAPKPAAKPAGCPDGMVEIAAGPYQAGSPPDDFLRDATERPLVKLSTERYCIDRYEFPNKAGARPKTNVSKDEAAAMCKEQGKRLCSEVEWEKACKGPRNNDYPYGKVWDPDACITETATGEDRSLSPLGSQSRCKSDYGVFDLSGNVMEWTATPFEPNPTLTIAKGGSYMRPDYAARCAYRYTTPANTRDAEIGFRCCSDYD